MDVNRGHLTESRQNKIPGHLAHAYFMKVAVRIGQTGPFDLWMTQTECLQSGQIKAVGPQIWLHICQ